MATCTKRMITPEPPPEEFVLTLSRSEAYTLAAAIMQGIDWNGTPGGSLLNRIYTAMTEAGVNRSPFGRFCAGPERGRVSPEFNPYI